MEKEGCVNGVLDTTKSASPMPIIGLYIAGATLMCFLSMAFDLVNGLIRRKPFLPCKFVSVNSFTLSVVAVATKLPVDLTTSMPRSVDQLSKLTGTAFLCISLGYFMPSLGSMSASERYSNMAALSIMVITMIVNVSIQMVTGVVFAFTIEHVIIMVCMFVLLILLWSSSFSVKGHRENMLNEYWFNDLRDEKGHCDHRKGLQWLKSHLEKLFISSYSGNPQSLLCQTTHCYTIGLLCTITSAIVLEAVLKSFVFKDLRFRTGMSDYGWSILLVVMTQILTIIVGGFIVISRGLTTLNHMDPNNFDNWNLFLTRELEHLRYKNLSFKFLGFIIDVLRALQLVVYKGTKFVVLPFIVLKKFLSCMVKRMKINNPFQNCLRCNHIEDDEPIVRSVSEIKDFAIIFEGDVILKEWITQISLKDMKRWMKVNKRDSPSHLIQHLHKVVPDQSPCTLSEDLQVIGSNLPRLADKSHTEIKYKYRVSCVSILVLAKMIANVAPSPLKESVTLMLSESFQIINFIDQKISTPSFDDELKWMAAGDVWSGWDNPNHWFQKKFMSPLFRSYSKMTSDESCNHGGAQDGSDLDQAPGALRNAREMIERYVETTSKGLHILLFHMDFNVISLDKRIQNLITIEVFIICKFILNHEYASIELCDFMEMTFMKMLRFFLRGLPLAIIKEVDGGDPYEVGEKRVRNAMKFLCKLELLGDNIQWLWPQNIDPGIQHNLHLTPNSTSGTTIASDYSLGKEANVSPLSITQDDGYIAAPHSRDDDEIITEV